MEITEADIFSRSGRIRGWFTHRNSDSINNHGAVPGLDLGLNTLSEKPETKANLSLLTAHLNIDISGFSFVNQVHGDQAIQINSPGMKGDADALITGRSGLTLAIQVADCAVILLADSINGVIAAVHAGWRGAVSGVASNTLGVMTKSCGAEMKHISAYISPAITVDHFEVGPEVASQFPDKFVDYESHKKPHVDLKAFLKDQLIQDGVNSEMIQVDTGCTWKDKSRYYSWRREGKKAGRMLGLIQLND